MADRRLASLGVHRKHMFLRVAAESLNVDAPKGVVIGSSLPVSLSNSGAPFLFVIWADFTPFELHKMSPISISLNCVVVMAVLLHQRSCRPPDERTPTEAWGTCCPMSLLNWMKITT